jgi:16S rRNA (cytosine967-C5)-methyltransferase
MTPGARLSAAIGIVDEIIRLKRPLASVLKDWGAANRYAGSGDRNAVGNLVHDALRVKASAAWLMGAKPGEDPARAVLLGMLRRLRGLGEGEIEALCDGERFSPPPLTAEERAALRGNLLADAPDHVLGDYPEWLDDQLAASFGAERVAEAAAMASRAPLDLRCNALKIIRTDALKALGHLSPEMTPLSPVGLRLLPNADGRVPHVQSEPAFLKGAVEVQDEGSQLVSLLAGAKAGEQVLDLCAGGGGKTLAMAAEMNNKGQIFATDADQRRLAPIHERLARAGVRNVQIRTPRAGEMPLDDLVGRMDLVLVDAPCTGTGTWRRHPDAKWRIRPASLELRLGEQRAVLAEAARFVKPQGRLAYITCSLLDAENGAQIAAFLDANPDFSVIDPAANAKARGLGALAPFLDRRRLGLALSPRRTGTDGFYLALLQLSR